MAESFKKEDYNSAEERFADIYDTLRSGEKFLHVRKKPSGYTYRIFEVQYHTSSGFGKKKKHILKLDGDINFYQITDNEKIYLSKSPEFTKHAIQDAKREFIECRVNNGLTWDEVDVLYDLLTKEKQDEEN